MAGVALAKMDWVGVAKIGLALKVEWGPVFAGEYREKAYRYGGESLRGRLRPTVIPVTSAAEVLIRGLLRACQHGLGRSCGNRFGLKGGVGAGVRRIVSGTGLPAWRCLSQVRPHSVPHHRRAAVGFRQSSPANSGPKIVQQKQKYLRIYLPFIFTTCYNSESGC